MSASTAPSAAALLVVAVVAVLAASCGETTIAVFQTSADAGIEAGPRDGDVPPMGDGDTKMCVCEKGQRCVRGACACPPYETLCDGACVPTSADPKHCGACDITCTGSLACSAGVCSSSCVGGQLVCNNSCVDPKVDNAHCGACGTACGAGAGCVDGQCQPTVVLGPDPDMCEGRGPPIIETSMQGGCLGNLAQSMFRWALCSCKDVRGGQLTTDGYDSRTGPYGPGGLAGGVAMNGNFVPTKAADIGGTLWVSATGSGLTIATASSVKQDLRVGGAVTTTAPLAIGHDAYVQGSISGGALLTIKGTLFLTPNATLGANATYGALVREPVTVPAPCDCSKKLNVRPLVVAHGMPAGNDDALVRLAPAVLDGLSGPRRLDLPCGRYYVTRIATTFPLTIIAHGRTALYVDGDVTSTAALTLAPTPGAELDVFIAGNLSASGALSIGSPSYAGSTRVYVAAKTTISSSAASIAGNLHAAGGALTLAAPEVYGAIVAGDFTGSAAQALHYDRAVLSAGNACPSATTCNSCEDCGNQACKGGTCGACASSAECCAPLACTSGRCVASLP